MNNDENRHDHVHVKPYTLTELSHLYGVNWRTLQVWMKPFEHLVGEKLGRYYTIPQVKIIFDKLGVPEPDED